MVASVFGFVMLVVQFIIYFVGGIWFKFQMSRKDCKKFLPEMDVDDTS